MSIPSISAQLADFVSRLSYDELPENLRQQIKRYLLDWLGSAYAGRTQRPPLMMLDVLRELGGKPESTIILDGSKTMCLLAALINGASSHVVEMDDLHRESVFHPGAAIMPAAFALAERESASGKELIVAITAGYEIGIRIAMAVGPSHYRYWHTTGTCGTFGAAAGAAKVLGLSATQLSWALGSAGTQAAGLWAFLVESAMSKHLHPGKAAMDGLLAALLAQKGFTGAQSILESEKGFFRATSQDFDENKCIEDLGKHFVCERNSLKFHASCGHTHSAIDAVLKATQSKPMKPEDIERVEVHTYQAALDLLGDVEPRTPYLAKFSMPFCVATALRYGHVSLEDFSPARLEDPDLLTLMGRIIVDSDPEISRRYPRKWPARVEIFLRDGRHLTDASDYPKGDPENPLSDEEVIEKFKRLTSDQLSSPKAERIAERVMNLEEMDDVSRLLQT
jgi:2-methylcitrate dehydratase PrpD